MKRSLILPGLMALLLSVSSCLQAKVKDTYTVIVSLDAFRWDYPDFYETPYLDSVATVGVRATMEPSFPSSTFPNHYTLATGLYPDHHGIVNSQFYDSKRDVTYSMGDTLTRNRTYYYGGEPIWATAERQGVRTACLYWVGSDLAITGRRPSSYRNWWDEPRLTYAERADEVVRLLSLPEEERPRLVMAYFDEPDLVGHHTGPRSETTAAMVHYLDSLMMVMDRGIRELPHGDRVNIIITSDHGMTDIAPSRTIMWWDVLRPHWVKRIQSTNPTTIFSVPEYRDSILAAVAAQAHLDVWSTDNASEGAADGADQYRKEQQSYGTSDRLGDIVVAPHCGWQFTPYARGARGAHGYFTDYPDMQVIFYAVGPDFKKNFTPQPYDEFRSPAAFKNVDIYPLLCKLLGIKPCKVDGSLKRVAPVLKK